MQKSNPEILARALYEQVQHVKDNLPALLEIARLDADERMRAFTALLAAGFTESQALYLVKK